MRIGESERATVDCSFMQRTKKKKRRDEYVTINRELGRELWLWARHIVVHGESFVLILAIYGKGNPSVLP